MPTKDEKVTPFAKEAANFVGQRTQKVFESYIAKNIIIAAFKVLDFPQPAAPSNSKINCFLSPLAILPDCIRK
jgi:hypothetical protein